MSILMTIGPLMDENEGNQGVLVYWIGLSIKILLRTVALWKLYFSANLLISVILMGLVVSRTGENWTTFLIFVDRTYLVLLLYLNQMKGLWWIGSFASVEWDEVFPEDVEALEGFASDVGGSSGAVLSGNSEHSVDLGPGVDVNTSHGLVGGVLEVVSEFSGSGFVGNGWDDSVETG